MAIKSVFVIFGVLAAFLHSSASLDSQNIAESRAIVNELCSSPTIVTEATAQGYRSCFDQSPGKAQIVSCQRQVFGGEINSPARIKGLCSQRMMGVPYGTCVGRELKGAGLDENSIVRQLNSCIRGLF